jgi:hypothetical protein
MRTFTCIILLVAFLPGCGNETRAPVEGTKPGFDSPQGYVSVLDLVRDEQARRIEARILVGGSERHLTVKQPEGAPLPFGFCAELTDIDRNLLFGLQLAWNPDTPDSVWVKEETQSDWLTLFVRRSGNRVTEEYIVNDEPFSVDYPIVDSELSPYDVIDSVLSESTEQASPEAKELVARIADFKAFYERYAGNTLNANPDGEVLVSLLNDEDFVNYAVGGGITLKRGYDGALRSPTGRWFSRFCALASLCSAIKCVATPGNPVCLPCTGASVTCGIVIVAEWITGKNLVEW